MMLLPFGAMPLHLLLASLPSDDEVTAEMAQNLRDGDPQAFRALFDRLHKPLLRYLLSYNISRESAEDLVQQAFVYIWEHRSSIDPSKSLRSYLFRIVYTRMLNLIRDRKKFDNSDAVPTGESNRNPEGDAENADLRDAIDRALDTMPEKRSTVFHLCYIRQLTYKEAAKVMDVSVKTIENHMSLALKEMRDKLKNFRPPD